MPSSTSLDGRVVALVPEVDPTLREELTLAVRTLREAGNPVGVLIGMSRLSLRLVRDILVRAGHAPPSQNLFDCIVTAASGNPERKTPGLRLLPDELASCLHTIRVLSNKPDHDDEQMALTVDDAENALRLFLRVVEWFYCEYEAGPGLSTIYDPAQLEASARLSESTPPTNVPVPPTPLIGRERELTDVLSLLNSKDVWLVSLTGVGGSGKTRLALEVATEVLDHFPSGVIFVDLSTIREPDLVVPRIAQTLEVQESSDSPLLERLNGHLRDKQLLLVLDNFEQVVTAAPVVAELHRSSPDLKVLVTSRSPIKLRGEREYPVPPLPLPDLDQLPPPEQLAQVPAVELFLQRAQDILPTFALTEANATAMAEVCVRLDGLPLAIELVAGWSRVLTLDAILARLSGRLDLLTRGHRDLPKRQQTMRVTIAWSYDLLDSVEQMLFRRLSVFVGGFSLEAAESVARVFADSPVDVLDGLASLVEKSLLRQAVLTGDPRFAMLETIRDYGLEQLAIADEDATAREAHAAYFLTFAERTATELAERSQSESLDQLEMWHDNLREAHRSLLESRDAERGLRLAVALWHYWWIRGHLSIGRDMMQRALASTEGAPSALRAKALVGAGALAQEQGSVEPAEVYYGEALTLAHELGDLHMTARALDGLGTVAHDRGDFSHATAMLEDALAIHQKLDDMSGVAGALTNLGSVALSQSEHERAQNQFSDALALFRQLEDERGVPVVLSSLGTLAFLQGDYVHGETLYKEALDLFRVLGDIQAIAISLVNLGDAVRHQGNVDRSTPFYQEALPLFRTLGDERGIGDALHSLAKVAQARRDNEMAWNLFCQSMTLFDRIGAKEPLVLCLEGLGGVASAQGQAAFAAMLLAGAQRMRDDIHAPRPLAHCHDFDQAVASARSRLTNEAFQDAWAKGEKQQFSSIVEACSHARSAAADF
jgi:predicted ATPase